MSYNLNVCSARSELYSIRSPMHERWIQDHMTSALPEIYCCRKRSWILPDTYKLEIQEDQEHALAIVPKSLLPAEKKKPRDAARTHSSTLNVLCMLCDAGQKLNIGTILPIRHFFFSNKYHVPGNPNREKEGLKKTIVCPL